MTEPFATHLAGILEKVRRWRVDAEIIRKLAQKAQADRAVSEGQLLSVEETSAAVYAEIAAFEALAKQYTDPTELEATMITEAGDALRLLSLEITELSTSMYAARSAWALDDGTPAEPSPSGGDLEGVIRPLPEGNGEPAEGDMWR